MSIHNEQSDSSETKPDRLASALLIIGFILVSLFVVYSIIFFLAGGWHLPPLILPLIVLGGICLLYGWFRASRGNLETRHLFTTIRKIIWMGMLAGSAAALFLALVSQINEVNGSWVVAFLVLSITWGLLLGIPSGGIGGLILASVWKNKRSAFIGGAMAGFLVAFWGWVLHWKGLG